MKLNQKLFLMTFKHKYNKKVTLRPADWRMCVARDLTSLYSFPLAELLSHPLWVLTVASLKADIKVVMLIEQSGLTKLPALVAFDIQDHASSLLTNDVTDDSSRMYTCASRNVGQFTECGAAG